MVYTLSPSWSTSNIRAVTDQCIGVNSSARKLVPKALESTPHITGFASYRAEINMERMKEDPELAELLERSSLNLWLVSIGVFNYASSSADFDSIQARR